MTNRVRWLKCLGMALLPLLLGQLVTVAVAQVVTEAPINRTGTATAGGRRVVYESEVATVPVRSETSKDSDGSVGYISYVAKAAHAGAAGSRPVLALFNGGPGASSTYLRLGAFGPQRVTVPQDPAGDLPSSGRLAANQDTLLDVADLVFLDPPGTGLSRLADDADLAWYHSAKGDAAAVAQGLVAWLHAHGRTDSPVYLLGESYGTIRAPLMVEALATVAPEAKVAGVILLGQALNMIETSQRPGNVVTHPVALPTLSAIACWHGKLGENCDPHAVAREATAFGPEYLAALYRGNALPLDARERVAQRLAQLTGIPSAYYLSHDLAISKEKFRVELLRAEGRVLGRYDARYTAPAPSDVGETVGADAYSAVSALYAKAAPADLASLGVEASGEYKVIAPPEGEWKYGSGDSPFNDWPFMARLEKSMARLPEMRLMVGTGLYDLTTTVGAADYLFAQSDLSPRRYRNTRYAAGHVFYSDDRSWKKLVTDLRTFIKGDPGP